MRFRQTHSKGLHKLLLTVSWDILPSGAHLMVSLYICSFGHNAQGKGPWRASGQLKKPFKGPSDPKTNEVAGRNTEHFQPHHEWLICLQERIQFSKKNFKQKKIWVSDHTWTRLTHPLARRSQNLTVLSLDAEANTGPENTMSEISDVIYVIPCERRLGLIKYVISFYRFVEFWS